MQKISRSWFCSHLPSPSHINKKGLKGRRQRVGTGGFVTVNKCDLSVAALPPVLGASRAWVSVPTFLTSVSRSVLEGALTTCLLRLLRWVEIINKPVCSKNRGEWAAWGELRGGLQSTMVFRTVLRFVRTKNIKHDRYTVLQGFAKVRLAHTQSISMAVVPGKGALSSEHDVPGRGEFILSSERTLYSWTMPPCL